MNSCSSVLTWCCECVTAAFVLQESSNALCGNQTYTDSPNCSLCYQLTCSLHNGDECVTVSTTLGVFEKISVTECSTLWCSSQDAFGPSQDKSFMQEVYAISVT